MIRPWTSVAFHVIAGRSRLLKATCESERFLRDVKALKTWPKLEKVVKIRRFCEAFALIVYFEFF